jgi:hypothetical protein
LLGCGGNPSLSSAFAAIARGVFAMRKINKWVRNGIHKKGKEGDKGKN